MLCSNFEHHPSKFGYGIFRGIEIMSKSKKTSKQKIEKVEISQEPEKIKLGRVDTANFTKLATLIYNTIGSVIEFRAGEHGLEYKGMDAVKVTTADGLIILENYEYEKCLDNKGKGIKFVVNLINLVKLLKPLKGGTLDLVLNDNKIEFHHLLVERKKTKKMSLNLETGVDIENSYNFDFWSDGFVEGLKDLKENKIGYISFSIDTDLLLEFINIAFVYTDSITLLYRVSNSQLEFKSEGVLGEFEGIVEKEELLGYQTTKEPIIDPRGCFTLTKLKNLLIPKSRIEIGIIGGTQPMFLRYVFDDDSYISFALAPRVDVDENGNFIEDDSSSSEYEGDIDDSELDNEDDEEMDE